MEKRELTCIGCPLGCAITVTLEGGEVKDVAGFTCKRGKEYACKEVTNPTRIVTSTVRAEGGLHPRCAVKTTLPVPKGMMMDVMKVLDSVVVTSPVKTGQVIVKDICGTGSDIVATRDL